MQGYAGEPMPSTKLGAEEEEMLFHFSCIAAILE
jgi:hypothetical protein